MGIVERTSDDARTWAERLEAENARLRRLLDEAGIDAGRADVGQAGAADEAVQAEIPRGEAFLREVLSASDDCIKVLDLDGRLSFMSEGGKRVMDVSDFNAIRGCPWPEFWEDEGNAAAKAAVAAAKAGGTGRFQGFARTMAGTGKWWDVQVTAIPGPDGMPAQLLSVSRDVSSTKAAELAVRDAEANRGVLTQELQHRLKNTLALVQAIANQTFRGHDTLEGARAAFEARIIALSAAHDILTQASWIGAPMHRVVENALSAHRTGQGRIRVEGPDLAVAAKPALALALALNELATNAAKYGALSGPAGHVELLWEAAGDRFRLRWSEHGGPPVTPPSRRGFGSRLVERSLLTELGGEVRLEFVPEGVTCKVDAPLAAVEGLAATSAS